MTKKSKYIGVSWLNNKWQVRITVNGKQTHIGLFEDEDLAALVHDVALYTSEAIPKDLKGTEKYPYNFGGPPSNEDCEMLKSTLDNKKKLTATGITEYTYKGKDKDKETIKYKIQYGISNNTQSNEGKVKAKPVFVGYYGTAGNEDDYNKAIIFRDCAIKLDDRILDKFSMYNREIEPSTEEMQEYQEWHANKRKTSMDTTKITPSSIPTDFEWKYLEEDLTDETDIPDTAATKRAMRGVRIVKHSYAINYNKAGRAIYVGLFGEAGIEEDRQQAITFHDCAVFLDKEVPDGPRKFNRPRPPNSDELESFYEWRKPRIKAAKSSESFNGVSTDSMSLRNPYKARCKLGGNRYIGIYETAYEAALAHDLAKRMFHKNNDKPPTNQMLRTLNLNFPDMGIEDLEKQVTLPAGTLKNILNEQLGYVAANAGGMELSPEPSSDQITKEIHTDSHTSSRQPLVKPSGLFNGVYLSSSSSLYMALCKLESTRRCYIGRYNTEVQAACAHDLALRIFFNNNDINPTNVKLQQLNFHERNIQALEAEVQLPAMILNFIQGSKDSATISAKQEQSSSSGSVSPSQEVDEYFDLQGILNSNDWDLADLDFMTEPEANNPPPKTTTGNNTGFPVFFSQNLTSPSNAAQTNSSSSSKSSTPVPKRPRIEPPQNS